MASEDTGIKVNTLIRRYEAHLKSGDHVLWEGSQQEIGHSIVDYFRETDPDTDPKTNPHADPSVPPRRYREGYVVSPGGSGKTIIASDFIVGINTMFNGDYVLGDAKHGKRVLITVPTDDLVDQWADRLLGERIKDSDARKPGIFKDRIRPEDVGIYHADLSPEARKAVLAKPIVVITDDSARACIERTDRETGKPAPLMRAKDFDAVIIDEVDDKPRGDVTGEFFRKKVFGNALVMGFTATHLYRTGMTIGDYLFGGKRPICEITHAQGVERKEIAGHYNIIVEPEIDPNSVIQPHTNRWEDYTEKQQLKIIEQTGSDKALLEVIRKGRHPKTGKPLSEMMQLHKAVNIPHAIHLAEELNEAFGKNLPPGQKYAEAVWGDMDKNEYDRIKKDFEEGRLTAVVQCKLWGRGTDFPALEMTVQHAPSLSPNATTQFHTRASRKFDGRKEAIYLSPRIPGIDQVIIGELLDGMIMLPDGYKFPPSSGKGSHPKPDFVPWPKIDGVKVYYTEEQLSMLARDLARERRVIALEDKPKNMLNLQEMAKQVGVENPEILARLVYTPLENAYRARHARDKEVNVADGAPAESGDIYFIRDQRFPERGIRHYRSSKKEEFCVSQSLIDVCRHALYRGLDPVAPEKISKTMVKSLTNPTGDTAANATVDKVWGELENEFFFHTPYTPTVIDGVEFARKGFGFSLDQEKKPELFVSPDALGSLYRCISGAEKAQAEQWMQTGVPARLKTSKWFTEAETLEALDLKPFNPEGQAIHDIFAGEIKSAAKGMRLGDVRPVELRSSGRGGKKYSVELSKRFLPMAREGEENQICVDENCVQWLAAMFGRESEAPAPATSKRAR